MIDYPKTLIPIEKLTNYRKAVGRAWQKKGKNNYHIPLGMIPDFTDENFKFYYKNDKELENSPILKIHIDAVEFAHKSVLSPIWIDSTKKHLKALKSKAKRLENYKERVSKSKLSMVSVSEPLGNTGNNLDKFEKPLREKRYKIQRFIQKNRLAHNNVCTCGSPVGEFVHLKKNPTHKNVSVGGVATCGSVWACPVCRAKIVNRRSKDLEKLYSKGIEKGYHFHMITFTVPHSFKDNLAKLYGSSSLRSGLSGAFTKFRQSRIWSKEIKPHIGYIGDVRSVEITFGMNNGFHPHIHMILISKYRFNEDRWQKKLLKQWQKNCISSGLEKPNKRGVKVDYVKSSEMVTYLSKWSVGSELSSDSAKEAKGKNYSIAQLELMLIDEKMRGLQSLSIDRIAGILKAYYTATKGQKQLVYGGLNNGWKKELMDEDLTDEQISSEDLQDEKEDHILILSKNLYSTLKSLGLFSEIIEQLEPMEFSTPNYHRMIYHKAQEIFYRMGIDTSELYSVDEFNKKFN